LRFTPVVTGFPFSRLFRRTDKLIVSQTSITLLPGPGEAPMLTLFLVVTSLSLVLKSISSAGGAVGK